jgi:hypothetical protein
VTDQPTAQPNEPGTAPAPLPPEVVSAILRDPDSPLYPSRIGVFCDSCFTAESNDYMVSDDMDRDERLEVARAHMRTRGWQCDATGDFCPEHRASRLASSAGGREEPIPSLLLKLHLLIKVCQHHNVCTKRACTCVSIFTIIFFEGVKLAH